MQANSNNTVQRGCTSGQVDRMAVKDRTNKIKCCRCQATTDTGTMLDKMPDRCPQCRHLWCCGCPFLAFYSMPECWGCGKTWGGQLYPWEATPQKCRHCGEPVTAAWQCREQGPQITQFWKCARCMKGQSCGFKERKSLLPNGERLVLDP